MSRAELHLLDLPVEILLNILKRLNNMDVLYSLTEVEGIGLLAQDQIFTQSLNFVPTDDNDNESMLNRFCNDILPRVQHNVKCLSLTASTMDRILRTGVYPNLTQLEIVNIRANTFSEFCTDELLFRPNFKKRITNLTITSNSRYGKITIKETTNLLTKLFDFFENLMSLNCVPSSGHEDLILSFIDSPSTTFNSSNLTKLSIIVDSFRDCFCILDGRLNHLSTLIVIIANAKTYPTLEFNSNVLLNLKCFSLTYKGLMDHYDTQVVPLVRQMCNLQNLTLFIEILERHRFVDGIQLQDDILTRLSKLQKFTFYISTSTSGRNDIPRLSEDDIQRTFSNFKFGQVGCTVGYMHRYQVIYNIFSLPYKFDCITFIGSTFTNTLFENITALPICDNISLEHEFFVRVAQCFPVLRSLIISNSKEQSKDSAKTKDDMNESFTVAEYPHLEFLQFIRTHIDYVDQMLNQSKTRLPRLQEISIEYDQLKNVTNNFTRNETKLNCINIQEIGFYSFENRGTNFDELLRTQSNGFYGYFPSLKL